MLLIGHHPHRLHEAGVVRQRLAHPHEDDVGDPLVGMLRLAELTGADEGVGANDLIDDLGGGHVACEPGLAGGAERAVHAASGLARHAQRDAARVAHQHRLDEGAVVQLPQELDRVAAVGGQAPHLAQERRQHPGDEFLAVRRRQVGHPVRVGGVVREVVLLELRGAEPGQSELLHLLHALLGGEVGQVHRRLAALGAGELQQRTPLGVLLLRPPLGLRAHLPHGCGLGRRRGSHGRLFGHVPRVGDAPARCLSTSHPRAVNSTGESGRQPPISARLRPRGDGSPVLFTASASPGPGRVEGASPRGRAGER